MAQKRKSGKQKKVTRQDLLKVHKRLNERMRYFVSLPEEDFQFIKTNVKYPDGKSVSSTDWRALQQAEFIRKYREHIQTQAQNTEVLQKEDEGNTDSSPTGE